MTPSPGRVRSKWLRGCLAAVADVNADDSVGRCANRLRFAYVERIQEDPDVGPSLVDQGERVRDCVHERVDIRLGGVDRLERDWDAGLLSRGGDRRDPVTDYLTRLVLAKLALRVRSGR